jgi:ribosomal protein S6--L-glutamate ligase
MPQTVITEDLEEAVRTVKRFGQTVLKPLFSTKARGMVLIEPGMDIQKTVQEFQQDNKVMYLQKLVEHPGWDLGVTYLGGKYLATYKRLGSETSWNTTIQAGGAYQPYLPESEVLALANRAQALFGLDFTCVDIVRTPKGLMIYEVSAFGGFRGLQDAHGIQAAELLADHVIDSLTKATGSPGLEQTFA